MKSASKKSLPSSEEPGRGGLRPSSETYKALAFNTLLSSQETDTHHPTIHNEPSSGATLLTYQASSPCQVAPKNRCGPETRPTTRNPITDATSTILIFGGGLLPGRPPYGVLHPVSGCPPQGTPAGNQSQTVLLGDGARWRRLPTGVSTPRSIPNSTATRIRRQISGLTIKSAWSAPCFPPESRHPRGDLQNLSACMTQKEAGDPSPEQP
jgi:hypothetical protein